MSAPESTTQHWADLAAARTLAAHPDTERITVAAGITPSGVVHVGNFREVITVDLVARALRDAGAKVRFIYSWDDFDVFRKVPEDMPRRDELREHLGRSIIDVPDPYGEHASYADHHVAAFERSLGAVGIAPEFIRQHARYRRGDYAEGIRAALTHAPEIRAILNATREQTGARSMVDDAWLPLAGFCDACGRDELSFSWDGEWIVETDCARCRHHGRVDLRHGGNVKLPWRVDWPMRWAQERVCFEPGGKDHSSAGGSYDTGKHIVTAVYGWTAPQYVGYDFVSFKGRGGKISSSAGHVVTLDHCLEVYQPEVLRWLFASHRPNTEFQISFDLDVLKIYEDFDRTVKLAHEPDDGGPGDRKRAVARRTLQFAALDHAKVVPGEPSTVPGFRDLGVTLQIFEGDIDRARRFYVQRGLLRSEADRHMFDARSRCAWNWLQTFAPDDFRYTIRKTPTAVDLDPSHFAALSSFVLALRKIVADARQAEEAEITGLLRAAAETGGATLKDLAPVLYGLLLGRDHGPRLATLISTMGAERALPLLTPSCDPVEP